MLPSPLWMWQRDSSQQASGKPGAVQSSLNVSANYQLIESDKIGKVSIFASYYYRTSFFTTNDINTARCSVPGNPNPSAVYVNCYLNGGKLPGYGIVNSRLDWRGAFGASIDLGIFVNNLTNKYYFPNAVNALNTTGTLAAQVGAPRMFGADVKIPFGR